jgi:cytochrome d ubiquinol oxidase subunit I
MVHRNFHDPVNGLDKIPRENWPPVAITFYSFHLMVVLGIIFIALTLAGSYLRWRGTLFDKRWLLWVFVVAVPLPYIANQVGWITAEVGRQPWVVYGLLRTSDALSKSVTANQVLGSIIMFILIYALLFAVWLFVLDSKIKQGPDEVVSVPTATKPRTILGVAGLRAGTGGASLTETGDKKPKE